MERIWIQIHMPQNIKILFCHNFQQFEFDFNILYKFITEMNVTKRNKRKQKSTATITFQLSQTKIEHFLR